ncbi:MAG TPA: Ig-like domain-containing protein [Segeticoccus sp.]|nr:Ig-like domain-containing protein [Segeticoccus sp.]
MSLVARRSAIVASTVVLALVATLLVALATQAQGEVVRRTDLNDGGVWVTNSTLSWFGRLNKPAQQLDAGIYANVAQSSGIDVLQDGAAVVGIGRASNSLLMIDPERAQLASSTGTPLPELSSQTGTKVYAGERVDLRGGTIAVVDQASGKVWAQRVDTDDGVQSLDRLTPTTKPLAKIGGVAAVAVGVDGTVYAVSAGTGKLVALTPSERAEDGFAKPQVTDLGFTSKAVDITAVGDRWVVFDPFEQQLRVAGVDEPIEVSGLPVQEGQPAYAALQQPGPEADSVLLEGPTAMLDVAFDDTTASGGVEVQDPAVQAAGSTDLVIARPVRLGACTHAAWAGKGRDYYGRNCGQEEAQPAYTIKKIGSGVRRDGVALRVNRGLIVLNDLDTGAVFDIDDNPLKIDDWTSVIPPPKQEDKHDKKDKNLIDDRQSLKPPKANPDRMKVRAGRVSTLHVLDNDTDSRGSILAIAPDAVTRPSANGVETMVSADGQAVQVDVPENPRQRTFSFTYTVNNGSAKKSADSTARVDVVVVGEDVNTAPHLRKGHAKLAKAVYPATPGANMSIGVVADWRDAENDPLGIEAVEDGTSVDGSGRLSIQAPDQAGKSRVTYQVSDGHDGVTQAEVAVNVLGDSARPQPPSAQADVVRAVAGKPVQLEPLGNDVPGADPGEPDAPMRLAAAVRAGGGLKVDTDLDSGVVTITGLRPGTYRLSYAAQVGAGTDVGKIRVDILPPPEQSKPPVAVPDNAVVRDQLPTLTDVLSNDYSPRSDVLVTQQVSSEQDWLQASIVKGRWVRVSANQPFVGSRPRHGTLTYTISDGTHAATGEVSVTQKPQPDRAVRPVVEDDAAVVRRGDAVTVPVLDNDSMAGGIPLRLDPRSVEVISGDGRAFASGNVVRYVPPPVRKGSKEARLPAQAVLEYAAYPEGLSGRAVSGRVDVQITPPPSAKQPNQPPVARSFTASVTAGDAVTLTVPTSGIDPDGDSVTLTGLSGLSGQDLDLDLGRVTSTGAVTIRYEAYPLSEGTDVIHYQVRDRYGATSTAFIRVGVVPPSDPQPPVAVEDEVVAQPGREVNADVLRNDLVSTGDVVSYEDFTELNDAETRQQFRPEKDHTITATVPDEGHPLAVTYGITDGLFDPSRTTLLVRGQKGFVNPPVAEDDVAKFKPGTTRTTVDVLENDHDLDGPTSQLTVVDVLDRRAQVVEQGDRQQIRVHARDHAYTVPYVIEDGDGARAMALIYVPTGDDGSPFVIPGKVIRMDTNSTKDVELGDYVMDPAGTQLHITSPDTLGASPSDDLSADAPGASQLRLTSSHGYAGPGAVTLEVATTPREGSKQEERTAYVSIPVQVGPLVPVLRCPTSYELRVVADGPARRVDIPRLCHAWLPEGLSMADVHFTAEWKQAPEKVSLEQQGPGGRVAVVRADREAPGGKGVLTVSAEGAKQSFDIDVIVQGLHLDEKVENAGSDSRKKDKFEAPAPTLRPISVEALNAGDSRTVDVGPYLDSPLQDPQCRITDVRAEKRSAVTGRASGCSLTIHAAPDAHGTARLLLKVQDGPGRVATGQVTVTVRGKPGAPTAVRAVADREEGNQARVWWSPPKDDGGLAIQHYTVLWKGGGSQTCTASPCTITGLENGDPYSFRVKAVNAVGAGPASESSNTVTPDERARPVNGVHRTARGDRTVTVAWPKPENAGSRVDSYRVSYTNIGTHPGTKTQIVQGRSAQLTGLVNNDQYSVKVQAHNGAGWGDYGGSVKVQSAGTPGTVPAPQLSPRTPTPDSGTGQVQISWNAVDPNGPALVRYTVYRRAGGGAWQVLGKTSPDTRTVSDTMPYDGTRYEYAVRATNGANKTSPMGGSSGYTANGVPATPSTPSASTPKADYRVRVSFSLGSSRSRGYTSVQWATTTGAGGTWSCGSGCAPGTTQTHSISGLSVNQNHQVRVRGRNTAGQWSNWSGWSNSVRPYGPTKAPNAGSTGESGRTLTYHWSANYNGRRIDRYHIKDVGDTTRTSYSRTYKGDDYPGRSHSIRVKQHTAAGWGPYITLSGQTHPPKPAPPTIYNVHKGPKKVDPNGSGSCRYAPGCPTVKFSIKNFPGNTNWSIYVNDRPGTGQGSGSPVQVHGDGNSYTWYGWILLSDSHDAVQVTLSRGGKTYRSAWTPW